MYKNKEIIVVIPARGGSKGIPRKNIVNLGGYPLIVWTIKRAIRSKLVDRVILSSEDPEIIQVAKAFGCEVPFERPYKLATDKASSVDVTLHTLQELNYKSDNQYFILLQPTSPFRKTQTIDKAIRFTLDNDYSYVMSVSSIEKSPYHIYVEKGNHELEPLYKKRTKFTRRQDLPKAVVSNGVLYVARASYFYKVKTFKPDDIRFFKTSEEESLDIDTYEDLKYARSIQETNKLQP